MSNPQTTERAARAAHAAAAGLPEAVRPSAPPDRAPAPGLFGRARAALAALRGKSDGDTLQLGGGGAWSGDMGNWVDSDAPGNRTTAAGRWYFVPGTRYNWDALTGPLYTCPTVQACLNWVFRNLPQAPPQVTAPDENDEAQVVKGHALTLLLRQPNPWYDGTVLFNCLTLSLLLNGNAYVGLVRTRGGRLTQLWWLPHHRVQPYTAPGSPNLIDYYLYTPPFSGQPQALLPSDVCHLRYGPQDPVDPRLALSPVASAARDANTLQQGATYRPNVLRNFGVIGKLVSPKTGDYTFEPDDMRQELDQQSRGDAVGGTVAVDVPVDVQVFKASAQDLDLTTFEDRPEANLAALIGVPLQVVGLYAGRHTKNYNNSREAREAAWEECLMPLGSLFGCQLGYRLLPEVGSDPEVETLSFDYSNVRPLQPDKDKLHVRVREDFRAGIIDRYRALVETGRPATEEDRGVYFVNSRFVVNEDLSPTGQTTPDREQDEEATAAAAAGAAGAGTAGQTGTAGGKSTDVLAERRARRDLRAARLEAARTGRYTWWAEDLLGELDVVRSAQRNGHGPDRGPDTGGD